MKSCPLCHQTYEDQTMVFCLVDGTRLRPETTAHVPEATLVLPTLGATEPGPTVASPRPALQTTIVAQPDLVRSNTPTHSSAAQSGGPPERTRTSVLPWLLGITVVLGFSGILIALILTRNVGTSNQQSAQSPTPAASPVRSPVLTTQTEESPTPTPKESTQVMPIPLTKSPARAKPAFSVWNNTSMNGSRITYYPKASFGACQADCARNPACQGATWIRPGAYNPGDAAMCYLVSSVTAKVFHVCCISTTRNQ
jgi:hypothetical protein